MIAKKFPRGVAFTATKKGTIRAYYIGAGFRYFPLPLAEARLAVATGEAKLVPYSPLGHWAKPKEETPPPKEGAS